MGGDPGRPRDHALDGAILDAALDILGEAGFDGLSIAAVAERAGTTRPAVYRRHGSRADLAVAALASLSEATSRPRTGDHLADLVAELTVFRDGITSVHGIALVATVLQGAAGPRVAAAYRETVVAPRRARLAAIIDAAHGAGELDGTPAERATAVTMCTGSWYASVLAGDEPPDDWPRRVARLVWRSLGGRVG